MTKAVFSQDTIHATTILAFDRYHVWNLGQVYLIFNVEDATVREIIRVKGSVKVQFSHIIVNGDVKLVGFIVSTRWSNVTKRARTGKGCSAVDFRTHSAVLTGISQAHVFFCTRCAGVRWQTAACEVIISSSIALSAIQARRSESAWVQVNSEVDVGANAIR
jgi:hypothetical protein